MTEQDTTLPPEDPAAQRRGRRMLLLLAVIFFGPFTISMLMWYGPASGLRPTLTTNNGELIQPAEPLPGLAQMVAIDSGEPLGEDPLRGVWTVLVLSEGACGEACRARLDEIDKVRSLLGRDNHRVQRVLLSTGSEPDAAGLVERHPGLHVLDASAATEVVGRLSTGEAGAMHISDPFGNLVMRYNADADGKALMNDLKRLLKLSRIG